MKEYPFYMENMKFGQKKNNIVLLQDNDNLFLSLKDASNQEISRIQVLHISKVKKLTNFFMRGFNISLEGKTPESMLIPEDELLESERKIIVTGDDSDKKIQDAINTLEKKFAGTLNRDNYLRTMVYLDTSDRKLHDNNMIFRLTQENNDVKATIHMDNNLPGDQKHIIKFIFTETSMPHVINFFKEALSLSPITKAIPSKRTEYKSNFGEVAIDKIEDENANYYSIELELDKFVDETRDSAKIDEAAKKIATELGLGDCEIVDLGTEDIYKKVSGKDYFEVYSNNHSIEK